MKSAPPRERVRIPSYVQWRGLTFLLSARLLSTDALCPQFGDQMDFMQNGISFSINSIKVPLYLCCFFLCALQ